VFILGRNAAEEKGVRTILLILSLLVRKLFAIIVELLATHISDVPMLAVPDAERRGTQGFPMDGTPLKFFEWGHSL